MDETARLRRTVSQERGRGNSKDKRIQLDVRVSTTPQYNRLTFQPSTQPLKKSTIKDLQREEVELERKEIDRVKEHDRER